MNSAPDPNIDRITGPRPQRARGIVGIVGIALALLLCACGGSADPQQMIETIGSWRATVELARAEHRAHGIGDVYARQLLDRARDAGDDARRQAASGALSRSDRARVDSTVAALGAATRRLASELRAR